MPPKRKVSNLLALAVLSNLSQQPMHPYELGRNLREHGDDRSIKFNHGSLYMVVGQLAKAGLVTEQETSRGGQRPERTVYAITDAGRAELRDWLAELVGQPRHEFPAFVAALSLISALPPGEVIEPAAAAPGPPGPAAGREPGADRHLAGRRGARALPDRGGVPDRPAGRRRGLHRPAHHAHHRPRDGLDGPVGAVPRQSAHPAPKERLT